MRSKNSSVVQKKCRPKDLPSKGSKCILRRQSSKGHMRPTKLLKRIFNMLLSLYTYFPPQMSSKRHDFIAGITSTKESWNIVARIVRSWSVVDTNRNFIPFSMEMDVIFEAICLQQDETNFGVVQDLMPKFSDVVVDI
ncbi:hypothetical protein CR513_13700, partial [Mucuna pruriens]